MKQRMLAKRFRKLLKMDISDLLNEHVQLSFSWKHFDRTYYSYHRHRFTIEEREALGATPTLSQFIRVLPKNINIRVRVVAALVLAHEIEEAELRLEFAGKHPRQKVTQEANFVENHEFVPSVQEPDADSLRERLRAAIS